MIYGKILFDLLIWRIGLYPGHRIRLLLVPLPLLSPRVALQLLVRQVASVQPVVLHNKQDIKENGEETQTKLCGVPEDGTPVVVVDADEEHLEDGKGAPGEVQQDVADAPANCTLSSVVHVRLGHVLDEGDAELDVGAEVEVLQPAQLTEEGGDETGPEEEDNEDEEHHAHPGYTLVPALVEEALDDRDEGGGHSVEREENIVGLNRVHTLRVKIKVFVLY